MTMPHALSQPQMSLFHISVILEQAGSELNTADSIRCRMGGQKRRKRRSVAEAQPTRR
jgi:hypothetical protein